MLDSFSGNQMKRSSMNNENRSSREPIGRITRARAKSFGSSGGLPPIHPTEKQKDKLLSRPNSKRAASEKNKPSTYCSQRKKRAVLKDVTNITCEKLYSNCINVARELPRKQNRKCYKQKTGKVAPSCSIQEYELQPEKDGYKMEEMNEVKMDELKGANPTENLPTVTTEIICPELSDNKKDETLEERGITNIDSNHQDPKMCSEYAADIYSILRTIQVDQRPIADYMEKMQHDITQGMRSILIDWLVEVSEEYRLVPDTLYLTVNLIDRFLSTNIIEKQKLQLLGVTCMLIASKYEEICAPGIEEFCIITDNTYTKEEVVKMESRVLNILGFQLFVPTTKKFLRRFIQAAQVSYEVPSVELEFLANYLTELTLIDYSFLKFLPSLIAASAVFLARWTLDQSDHPWNLTLEHYTKYKSFQLKYIVLKLQDLQLNTSGSMLNAIREKYKQSKFKCVSTLRSPKPVQSLF